MGLCTWSPVTHCDGLVSSPLVGTVDGYCKQDHLVRMGLRRSLAVVFYSELIYMRTEIGRCRSVST